MERPRSCVEGLSVSPADQRFVAPESATFWLLIDKAHPCRTRAEMIGRDVRDRGRRDSWISARLVALAERDLGITQSGRDGEQQKAQRHA